MYSIKYDFCGVMIHATTDRFNNEQEAYDFIKSKLDKTTNYEVVDEGDDSLFGFKHYWENKLTKRGC